VRVHGGLGFGGIPNQTLGLREGNVGGSGAVSLVIGDDFDTIILPDADARVGGAEIDSDRFSGYSSHDCAVVVVVVLE